MHVFVCVFLTNHQWSSKRQHELNDIINQRCYRISQSRSESDLSIAKLTATLVRFHSEIVRHWLDNLLQNLHEHLYSSSKYLTKTYAFVRQIDALSSVSFRRFFNSISISISLRHHENLYFRDLYRWYDFDFFFVEVVIHIRKTISESVNHSILFQRNTSFSFQDNHDRRWLFRKEQFNKFEWYEMSDLLLEIIHEILHFQIVAKASLKRITLFVRSTISAESRVEKYCCKVENRIFFCFACQVFWHIREQTSESRQMT